MMPGDRITLRTAIGEARQANFETIERTEGLRLAAAPVARRSVRCETRGLHVARRAGGAR